MASENWKIRAEDLIIEKLTEKHDLASFQSFEPELVAFLKEDALKNQKENLYLTFLWFFQQSKKLMK